MEKFKQLGLSEGILDAVSKKGFTEPSEIQEKTIPLILQGKDVIASSATGSGKTFAFGAGIIDKIQAGNGVQSLILTPTRELAEQVASNLRLLSNFKRLKVREIYGGVSMEPQIYNLRNADLVVGTPGRILDHLDNRTLNLMNIKFLVLDEADRMLDMGFIRDVEKIINSCQKQRQTLLFSATISHEIKGIAQRHMLNPLMVSAGERVDPAKLCQKYYEISSDMKFSLLLYLLKQERHGVAMIFCNTRKNVDRLTEALYKHDVRALPIHGGLSQNQRNSTLKAFHERKTNILICTDVAARGLDIKDISHVYNFDLPELANDYIHRIGRTARAGKNGIAVSFVSGGDRSEFRQILNLSFKIEEEIVPKISNISISFSSNDDRRKARQNNRGRHNSGGNRGRRFGRGNSRNRNNDHSRGRFGRSYGRGGSGRFRRR